MPLYVRSFLATGPPDQVRQASVGHREQLRELQRAGKLHVAGEFANGDGFLEILRADDLLDAEAITQASPLIEQGLGAWHLREWLPTEFPDG